MKYLLDTCVISDFIKGDISTSNQLRSISPLNINISSITVMELEYGLALNAKRSKTLRPVIEDILSSVSILSFDSEDAEKAAHIRSILKKQGPIGAYEVLLAGTALNRNLILVSSNTAEFKRVDGLMLENWRD